ncbi:MAG: type II toxin-antitoxin system RelE/ParE family toxin [Promethearchaeota archaeon]
MNYSLRFHPDVEEDLLESFSWYERKSVGLGDKFLQIFYSSSELIIKRPFLYPKIYHDFRRYLLHKFPYALYYLIKKKQIIIVGLFHYAQNPGRIKTSLQKRKE